MVRYTSLHSLVNAVAASCFSFGFNTGIIAGALLYLNEHFPELRENALLSGMLTASVFGGAFFSNAVAGPVADCIGRVPVLVMMNVPFIIGAGIAASAPTPWMVILGRFVTGLAVGIAGSLPNLYIAEVVPKESRGNLVGRAPLLGTLGICLAQVFSFFIAELDISAEMKWRTMLGAGLVPPIFQAILTFGVPESPRWCYQRGLTERASKSNAYLAGLRDGCKIPAPAADENARSSGAEPQSQMSLGLALVAVGLSAMQQLSGVNAVIFYAPTFYANLDVPDRYAILVGACNSMAQVCMTMVMLKLVDRWGRRTMCLLGLFWMAGSMIMLGFVFIKAFRQEFATPAAVAAILCYRLAFSLSMGPLPYIMLTELFPQHLRSKGVAISMMANWSLNTLVVFVVPEFVKTSGGDLFFAFATVCIVCMVLVDMFLPETSGRSLEETADSGRPNGCIAGLVQKCRSRSAARGRVLQGRGDVAGPLI